MDAILGANDGGTGTSILMGIDLNGGAGDDTLNGTAAADSITGGPGADRVVTSDGNDTIDEDPASEPDLIDGGPGIDTISFAQRTTGITAVLMPSSQTAGSTGEANVLTGIEIVTGSSGPDDITYGVPLPAFSFPDISAGSGDDKVHVLTDLGGAIVDGGAGADQLKGGPAVDRLNGGAGSDVIDGADGNDSLVGGSGNDRLLGGDGADRLVGESGNDRLLGGHGADRLLGESGNDRLSGGTGTDLFSGGAGIDRLSARDRRREHVNCGAGRDFASADSSDRISGCERFHRG